jgi:hypothetical protein
VPGAAPAPEGERVMGRSSLKLVNHTTSPDVEHLAAVSPDARACAGGAPPAPSSESAASARTSSPTVRRDICNSFLGGTTRLAIVLEASTFGFASAYRTFDEGLIRPHPEDARVPAYW